VDSAGDIQLPTTSNKLEPLARWVSVVAPFLKYKILLESTYRQFENNKEFARRVG